MNDEWALLENAGRSARGPSVECAVDGCSNPRHTDAEGDPLCHGHYWRWRRDEMPVISSWLAIPQPPVRVKNDDRTRRSVRLNELPIDIAHEIRFVFGTKLSLGDWTPTAGLRIVLEALHTAALSTGANSFTERRPEDWYLLTRQCSPSGRTKKWDREMAPYLRSFFHTLNRALVRDPWSEDTWLWKDQFDQILGGDRFDQRPNLFWVRISQSWLREPLKQYARLSLQTQTRSWSTLNTWVRGFSNLSEFLERCGIKDPRDLTRKVLLLHLEERRALNGSGKDLAVVNTVASVLSALKLEEFLPELGSEVFLRQGENTVAKIRAPRPWPSDVLRRIEQELIDNDDVDQQMRLMLRFCRWAGPRVSELASLPIDALIENGNGGFWIEYWMPKVEAYRRFPVLDPTLGELLAEQARTVREEYGPEARYLFPQPRMSDPKFGRVRPWTGPGFAKAVGKLFIERGIVDSSLTGEVISGADIHRFRHTIGTQLLNAGWTQQQVQQFLGHQSPTMTAAYAQILDETLNRKADEFHRLVQSERAAVGAAYSDPVVERLRQLSTAVNPLGFCNLPASQHCSVRDNPCLSCSFFAPGDTPDHARQRDHYREQLVRRIDEAVDKGQQKIEEINRGILDNLDALTKEQHG